MNQVRHSHIGVGWLVASAIVLVSAGALAAEAGKLGSSGRSVNEVQGRSSESSTVAGGRSVNTATLPAVSEVVGRASQMSAASGAPVGIGAADVGDFGRASGTLVTAHGKSGTQDASVALAK
jgi:hypothetical protein